MKQIIILASKYYHVPIMSYSSKNQLKSNFLYLFQSQRFLILCFIIVLLLIQGCSREEPIKIGFIGGLTGRVADLGISGRNGALLAIEKRNSLGGINGNPVQLVAVDDKQDTENAKSAFLSLIDQGVDVIIGHMTSSMSVTTVPLANSNRIVLMSPTSTTTHLKDLDDYFFRVCATTDIYGKEMARYFYKTTRIKRVTTIYDLGNKSYTESWIKHFSDEFTRLGGKIVKELTYTSGPDIHFDDIARQTLDQETEGIIISSSAVDTAILCQQIRKLNNSVLIGTSEWASTEKLIELGGIAVENIIVSQFFDRFSTAETYMQFKEEFIKRFGQEPGFPSVASYDATSIVLEALTLKKDNQDLKQTILNIGSFNGVQGKINLNRHGDSDRKTYRSIILNGKFVSPYH